MIRYFPTLLVLAVLPLCHADSPSMFNGRTKREFYEIKKPDRKTIALDNDVVQNVYVAVGYETYLEFPKEVKIEGVSVGSKSMVQLNVDAAQNAITIYPLVVSGSTNMTVLFEGKPYTFNIIIRKSGDIQYRVTYTLPNTEAGSPKIAFGPKVEPGKVDYAGLVRDFETLGKLRTPTRRQVESQYAEIGKTYSWNGELLYLADVMVSPKENVAVLRLVRRNASPNANYLHTNQLSVRVANTTFPVTGGIQSTPQLYPGQVDKIYLVLQGYSLLADNPFELGLPPEAGDVQALITKR